MPATFNADILGRLSEATPDELNAALAAIRDDFQTYASQPASQDNVNRLGELRTAATQIREELSTRANLSNDQAAALAALEALTALEDTGEAPAEGDAPAEEAPEGDAPATDAPAEGDAPAEPPADTVTAAATRRPLGTARSTTAPATSRARRLDQVVLRTTAAAGVPGYAPGQEMSRADMAAAFSAQAAAVSGAAGFERYPVVTMRAQFPESRMLRRGVSAFTNMERVEAVVDQARTLHARDNLANRVQVRSGPNGAGALTAAGLCAPLETLYDIRVIGDTDRPIRDALARFGAERGGIQYRPAQDGVTQTGGIGAWTVANDTATPLVPKTCVEIACPGVVTANVEAIYQCLTFSNMSSRFDPEAMDANIRSQAIAHARFAENRLYGQLVAGSKAVYSTQVLGATRDILVTMDQMTAYYRNVHRLNNMVSLRWIAPAWVQNLMRADITRQMVGDGLQSLAVTDQAIAQWLAERNLNVTWHLDGIDPADLTVPTPDIVVPAQFYTLLTPESAVPGFPDAISSLLFAEGDWLYLDGGDLNLGVVRDSTLNSDNRFQTFSEEFAFPAFRGIESIHLVIRANPTGQAAATKDTSAIAD